MRQFFQSCGSITKNTTKTESHPSANVGFNVAIAMCTPSCLDYCSTVLQCSLLSLGGKVKDEHVSLLINGGVLVSAAISFYVFRSFFLLWAQNFSFPFLRRYITISLVWVDSLCKNLSLLMQVRQLIDPDMYWFAIPSIGSVLKGLSQV